MTEYKVGDKIKYTYFPGDPESGWFVAEIAEIRENGQMVANLVDKGERTGYATNTFNGINIGDKTNPSVELYSERLGGDVIGTAPVVAEPMFVAPFSLSGFNLRDRNNKRVTYVDSDEGSKEDQVIGEVLVAALNQYYGVE